MPSIPYMAILQVVLGANSTGTMTYQIPVNEALHIKQLEVQSTGTFIIYDIRNSQGYHFTNASQAIGILNTFIQPGNNANAAFNQFMNELLVDKGSSIYFDVKDTSGAGNTVNLLLNCIRDVA